MTKQSDIDHLSRVGDMVEKEMRKFARKHKEKPRDIGYFGFSCNTNYRTLRLFLKEALTSIASKAVAKERVENMKGALKLFKSLSEEAVIANEDIFHYEMERQIDLIEELINPTN